ncbi:unnamed protein product [Discula destructiva]
MCSTAYTEARMQSLAEANLVPGSASGVIPDDFKPKVKLEVTFNGKPVENGNFFRAGECKTAPAVTFQPELPESSSASYTLMLVDPDAPTPDDPKFAFWRHWIVPGLQPLSGDSSQVAETKPPITKYHPPGPKDDSKPHRYLFLLFREPAGFDPKKEDVGGEEFVERRSFKVADTVAKFGLEIVGLNWMTCAGDGWKE